MTATQAVQQALAENVAREFNRLTAKDAKAFALAVPPALFSAVAGLAAHFGSGAPVIKRTTARKAPAIKRTTARKAAARKTSAKKAAVRKTSAKRAAARKR